MAMEIKAKASPAILREQKLRRPDTDFIRYQERRFYRIFPTAVQFNSQLL
jgi:hypothetical protein